MFGREELIQKLKKFGFTEYEAKTFIALSYGGILSVPKIAKLSGVPKSQVYTTIDKLIKRAVIEEFPGKPRKFKAKTPRFVFENIIKERNNVIQKLKGDASVMVSHFDNIIKTDNGLYQDDDSVLWIVEGKRAFFEKYVMMLNRCRKRFFIISPTFSIYSGVEEKLRYAKRRGIKTLGLTSLNKDNRPNIKFYLNFFDEVRNVDDELPITIVLSDDKECLYRVRYRTKGRTKHIAIHTVNPGLVKTFYKYGMQLLSNSKKIRKR